jgi:tubulin monoglycylase TTLL3/8
VFGFDIVLDLDLNPWVIEINLSPACAERTDWLSCMLENSALDLCGHLE